MAIPTTALPPDESSRDAPAWGTLTAEQKRERALEVAGEIFAREGLDVPMPIIAEAIGAGVGSIYRQIGKKEDLVALLLVSRIDRAAAAMGAARADADPVRALWVGAHAVVEDSACDSVSREAWTAGLGHPTVQAARAAFARTRDEVVARAARDGALRPDASGDDLRLLFAAIKNTGDRAAAHRLADLVLLGMLADGRRAPDAT